MKSTIDMAKEAGLLTWLKPPEDVIERFKAFEALIRADEREIEREACAKVCETYAPTTTPTWVSYAAAIRARGNT
jgi:hypothetical protein